LARSTLRYVLPFAGLLFVAPAQAGPQTTVRDFLTWSANEQVMYLAGVVDVLGSEMSLQCPKGQTVGEMVVRIQIAGQTSPSWGSTQLLTAVGQVLKEYNCTLGGTTSDAASVDPEDLS
jgi:hypothetical protein